MAIYTHEPHTYREAEDIIRKHGRWNSKRAAKSVRLGYATTLEQRGHGGIDGHPAYAVVQHDTDVVTFYRNGVVGLRHEGWVSVTTKERWQTFTPRGVAVSGKDIQSRRTDADPRFIVSNVQWKRDVVYGRDVPDWTTETELSVSRREDGPLYLIQTYSPATRSSNFTLAPSGFVDNALAF